MRLGSGIGDYFFAGICCITGVHRRACYHSYETSDYSWIPFEELEGVGEDIGAVFGISETMEEERIEAIVRAVEKRIGKLKVLSLSSSL